MKKVALVFVLAVFVPSLVLAWLAVRSLRDQKFLLERQQSLIYQGVADSMAGQVADALVEYQRSFGSTVVALLGQRQPRELAKSFDDALRRDWPLAQVGFVVTSSGDILCPSPFAGVEAQMFCADNGRFLANREPVEVYSNTKQVGYPATLNQAPPSSSFGQNDAAPSVDQRISSNAQLQNSIFNNLKIEARNVVPQYKTRAVKGQNLADTNSQVAAAAAEFRQLIGDDTEGTLARFVDNKLNILFWYRSPHDPTTIFGTKLALGKLVRNLQPFLQQVDPSLRDQVCVALLDDTAKPAALSHAGFHATWKHPFVATEIGESLPHWEIAIYLLDPARLTRSAQTLKLTLGLLIALLVLAIGLGSWLIVADLNRQLTLARQKTDFVSNVSHELKTPLTSIRMFSELLQEGRVNDPAKQRSYLNIIAAETARLTRLINNVLDFARIERGEKKYHFQDCELVGLVHETAETYRAHLEANGFQFDCRLPEAPLVVKGDRDALAQVVVNLLSNAEKYSDSRKEITLELSQQTTPLPFAEIKVLDRGIGVPEGCGEKIFEKFYRAHDSLSSGIQGSGLGLTLARQIARAHGGEVAFERRDGGGSCFLLRLPLQPVPARRALDP